MKLSPVIGLEVHLQLRTETKIFCGCPTKFGAPPNSQVCPICLGFPGVLPVLNRQVFLHGLRVALALRCGVQSAIIFHRKNYFYPDLPKGYQISQFDLPLGSNGIVEVPLKSVPGTGTVPGTGVGTAVVRINRVHMEEDAGKLVHKPDGSASLVDFNRGGVPLLEIVSEPDMRSPEQAYEYLKALKGILGYLDVSDCDMEKGSLRCDANVSLCPVKPDGSVELSGMRVEIKNLNSFRAVARALSYEIQRQTETLKEGEKVAQETRLWDDVKGATQGMRSKEFAHDYRYFPEPDLAPFTVPAEKVEEVRRSLPELPAERAKRLADKHGLPAPDAAALTASRATADYFEEAVKHLKSVPGTVPVPGTGVGSSPKVVSNWILGEIAREMNERNAESIGGLGFSAAHLVELIGLIDSGKISGKMAKEVFVEALRVKQSPAAVVQAKGMAQVTDRSAIRAAGEEVVKEHAQAAADFRGGKNQALMFLVGQLMRRTKGAASPALAQEILKELLERPE
ncbi:MAG: Asp-tRNA(Asn)/Glu-tRNA(Gln) amidotransferase subunit GatB [Candidatus Omnitrophica bacterium]|nr:Asp-tRNA(Asn)/Glu-tRNA(Gln) amidotransferase subunit GatB [Candidatus Omnitrophota bacterium]